MRKFKMSKAQLPSNESERLASLRALDLDYSELEDEFQNFVKLVSRTTGMDVSLVNLIDTFRQWTIANYGLTVKSMSREDSVCQFTILEKDHFEVKDLSLDENHKDKFYVTGNPHLRYYFGVPLKTSDGVHIGSLCVLDKELKTLSNEQIEFLKIIADEVVNKLKAYKLVRELKNDLDNQIKDQKTIALELQDSLAGIIGISEVLIDKDMPHTSADAEGFVTLINERGKSMIELTRKLFSESGNEVDSSGICLVQLKEKLVALYGPLARSREQKLEITINELNNHIYFSRAGIFSALNYPISGTLYSSEVGSAIFVKLDIGVLVDKYLLKISIKSNSNSSPDPTQLYPPEQVESEFHFFSETDGWHIEVGQPLLVT